MEKKTKSGLYARFEKVLVGLAATICIVTAISSITVLRQSLNQLNSFDYDQPIYASQLEINFNNALLGKSAQLPELENY